MNPEGSWGEVVIERGALGRIASLLSAHAPAAHYAVVADSNVAPLHGRPVVARLEAAGLRADLVTVAAGEGSKTPAGWAEVVESLARVGLGRDGCVVAAGGGVIGDLAGFAAATYARGISLVQVPTSLLAMVDAALGGKTAIDLAAGKNLAGAFHPPRLVVVDALVLDTLPREELADGLAEAVKHGAVADASYLKWIEGQAPALLDREPAAVDALVAGSIRIKMGIVDRDPWESGERAILNFGHTIAHAMEVATGYAVRHGHAVALGMVAEAAVGEEIGVTRAGTARQIRDALVACGLPVDPTRAPPPAELVRAARTDKKSRAGATRYALLKEAGTAATTAAGDWTHAIPDDVVTAVLGRLRAAPPAPSGV
jgi:3-dehydroquinate synthase